MQPQRKPVVILTLIFSLLSCTGSILLAPVSQAGKKLLRYFSGLITISQTNANIRRGFMMRHIRSIYENRTSYKRVRLQAFSLMQRPRQEQSGRGQRQSSFLTKPGVRPGSPSSHHLIREQVLSHWPDQGSGPDTTNLPAV